MSLSGILMSKGAAVVFSHTVEGSYDASNDTTTPPVTTTYPGRAMQIDRSSDVYKSLELIDSKNNVLEFRPVTHGGIPPLGATVLWGGETLTVKSINTLAMNGVATAAFISVGG